MPLDAPTEQPTEEGKDDNNLQVENTEEKRLDVESEMRPRDQPEVESSDKKMEA